MIYRTLEKTARIDFDPPFLLAAERAVSVLSRLDERLIRVDDSQGRGVCARLDYHDAHSLVGLSGGFLHFSDFVLFDHDMSTQVPSFDMERGRRVLQLRRRLGRLANDKLLVPETLAKLSGLPESEFLPPAPSLGIDDVDEEEVSDLDAALGDLDALLEKQKRSRGPSMGSVLEEARQLPAIAGAVLLFDFWLLHEHRSTFTEVGPLLASLFLRSRGIVSFGLPGLCRGLWRMRGRWQAYDPPAKRYAVLAESIAASAAMSMADCDRLVLAKQLMDRKLTTSKRDESLRVFVDLLIENPLVNVELAVRTLKITPQAVELLIKRLGDAMPPELTGRSRYRAWGII
jgi:hypothetical protein